MKPYWHFISLNDHLKQDFSFLASGLYYKVIQFSPYISLQLQIPYNHPTTFLTAHGRSKECLSIPAGTQENLQPMVSEGLSSPLHKMLSTPIYGFPPIPNLLNISPLKACWSMKHEQWMNNVWSLFKVSYKETRTVFLLLTLNWFHTSQGFPQWGGGGDMGVPPPIL